MTEDEWNAGNTPERMLGYLLGREYPANFGWLAALGLRRDSPAPPGRMASNRKLRLFACACCRRIRSYFWDKRSRRAALVAERYADGLVRGRRLQMAQAAALAAAEALAGNPFPEHLLVAMGAGHLRGKVWAWAARAAVAVVLPEAAEAAEATASAVERTALEAAMEGRDEKRLAVMAGAAARAGLLRDIFGNPFRSASLAASCLTWRAGLIPSMAATIYDERRFRDLPILADALEEAGCTHAAILGHCRGRDGHVRGCWVVDALLGKE
jgi:hypothetical protein